MSDTIHTDVLVVGTGPAGATAALSLATLGVEHVVITKYRWTANTPRAHITNQRTVEIFRDLGIEDDIKANGTPHHLMGDTVFCTSLSGDEIGRVRTWGTHPARQADYTLASPCTHCDLPQTLLEPILIGHAAERGSRIRFDTEYLGLTQDDDGVKVRVRDRLSGNEYTIEAKYLIGADGGRSKIAQDVGLPFEGQMDVAGSMNIVFHADLSAKVEHRPSVLYWVLQPGSDIGGIGMGLVRMVRPWNEWLIVWGYDINEPPPELTTPPPPRSSTTSSATTASRSRSAPPRCGATTRCTRRGTAPAGCSAWATPCTAIRRPTGWAPTRRSRTPTTSAGSSRSSCAVTPAPACSTAMTRSARRSAGRSSCAPTSPSRSSARSSRRWGSPIPATPT